MTRRDDCGPQLPREDAERLGYSQSLLDGERTDGSELDAGGFRTHRHNLSGVVLLGKQALAVLAIPRVQNLRSAICIDRAVSPPHSPLAHPWAVMHLSRSWQIPSAIQ